MNLKKFLSVLLLLLLVSSSSVFAQDEEQPEDSSEEPTEESQAVERSEAFLELQRKINDAKSSLTQSVIDTSLLEQRLSEVSDEIDSLEDQIANLDNQLNLTEKRIETLGSNIRENENRIDELNEEIDLLEIEEQKQNLSDLIVTLYYENESAGFFDDRDLQTIKLLLSDEKANEILDRSQGLSFLEFSLEDLLTELSENRDLLLSNRQELEQKTRELRMLRDELKEQEVYLKLQRSSKEKILEQTQGEEDIYRELIQRAKQEQISIRNDINRLVGEYAKYRSRFGRDGFGTDQFGVALDADKLSWPVSPDLGISAFFRDPTYRAALGVEHNAVDVRKAQGSNLYAAADGVVLKTKGGEGLDYHYIIIAHNGGLMTLYGHVSEILVIEGQNVNRGEIVGLTGGLPGTKGAGWLTTGPHLHFEVLLNGVHVDPMLYLDLTEIAKKYVPSEYLQLISD